MKPASIAPHPTAPRWPIFLLLTLTLLTFGRLCTYDFVRWDDDQTLHQNPLMNPPTWRTLQFYWTRPFMGLYTPVTFTTWAGLASIAKLDAPDDFGISLNPWPFHIANVLLHAANVLLVYAILRRLVRHDLAALSGALIFSLHPVQVESVAWISGLKDLLCGTFVLSALWNYTAYAQNPGTARTARAHYWLGFALMCLGLLSKPTAVVTPLLAASIDLFILRRPWRHVAASIWPWFVATIPCLIWSKLVQTVPPRGPLWSRPLVALDAIAFYLGRLLWPYPQAVDYGRNPAYVIRTGAVWWTWTIPAALAIYLFTQRHRRPMLLAAGAIFVAGLLPLLGFTPFMFQYFSTVSDHYLYLPMLGVALFIAYLVSLRPTRLVLTIAAIITLALATRSFVQAATWRDEESLCRHTLSVNPDSYAFHLNFGNWLEYRARQTGDESLRDQGIRHLRRSIELRHDAIFPRENLATILIARGQIDEAIQLLLQATELSETHSGGEERINIPQARRVLAAILSKRGRHAEAVTQLRAALARDPQNPRLIGELQDAERNLRAATTQPAP